MNGYKARLLICLNVFSIHISVFLQIMKGPYDDTMEWPMPYDAIFFKLMINEKWIKECTIRSNENYKVHSKRPTEEEEIIFCRVKLFPLDQLPNSIENDTVSIVRLIEYHQIKKRKLIKHTKWQFNFN